MIIAAASFSVALCWLISAASGVRQHNIGWYAKNPGRLLDGKHFKRVVFVHFGRMIDSRWCHALASW